MMPLGPIIQIPYHIPPDIEYRLATGAATRSGQIIRDAATGRITDHLKPVAQGVAESVARFRPVEHLKIARIRKVSSTSRNPAAGVARYVKKNPLASALFAAGTAGVAYVVHYVVKELSTKQHSKEAGTGHGGHDVVDVGRHLESAIKNWLEAATQSNLTEEVVNDLAEAYAAYREAAFAAEGTPHEPDKWEREFYALFADYTMKVAQANGVEFESPQEASNVVDLTPYIECQQELFTRGSDEGTPDAG